MSDGSRFPVPQDSLRNALGNLRKNWAVGDEGLDVPLSVAPARADTNRDMLGVCRLKRILQRVGIEEHRG